MLFDWFVMCLVIWFVFLVVGFGIVCWVLLVLFVKVWFGVDDGVFGFFLFSFGIGFIVVMMLMGFLSVCCGS